MLLYISLFVDLFALYIIAGIVSIFIMNYYKPIDLNRSENIKLLVPTILFWLPGSIKLLYNAFRVHRQTVFEHRFNSGRDSLLVRCLKKAPTQERRQAKKELDRINNITRENQKLIDNNSTAVLGYDGWSTEANV